MGELQGLQPRNRSPFSLWGVIAIIVVLALLFCWARSTGNLPVTLPVTNGANNPNIVDPYGEPAAPSAGSAIAPADAHLGLGNDITSGGNKNEIMGTGNDTAPSNAGGNKSGP